jgi:Undecaprenyl-phosphate galactose phosphotransferase WbaP
MDQPVTALNGPEVAQTLEANRSPGTVAGGQYTKAIICAVTLLAVDCVAALAAAFVASNCITAILRYYSQSYGNQVPFSPREAAGLFLLTIIYLASKGRYTARMPFWSETGMVVAATAYAAFAATMLGILTNNASVPMLASVAMPAFWAFATAGNQLAKLLLSRVGVWNIPVLLIGSGSGAADARTAVESDRSLGYRIVGQIDAEAALVSCQLGRLGTLLERHDVRCLFVALDADDDRQGKIVNSALRERVPFLLAPPRSSLPAFASQPMRLIGCGTTSFAYRSGQSRPFARFAKTTLDIAVATLLLAVTGIILIAIAALIKLDGGPAFFAQRRIGAGGRPFFCLKFRTMVPDATAVLAEWLARDEALAAEWAATRKLTTDPRVTRIGRFLRKTSLDELPQLINVLKLEMSLVGPRPIVDSEIALYGDNIAQYYAGRPGITGLWQVSGRSDTSYERRVELDSWYVNNWTIWNDITVLLKTIPAVLGGQGAR